MIDTILPYIAAVLPVNVTINILNPVIATGQYPMNLCALKLLTELAGKQGNELTDNHLESIFPHLSRVRKKKKIQILFVNYRS